ncbi:MAG: alpha/beta fold hydrolase [Candidatus Rokubacteria bacterium]|nr:alpha/beta fold hydrolase [Candidatus Rokubacteria bacterium]
MRDELFTMMADGLGASPGGATARMEEELQRNLLRMKHFTEMVMHPVEPEIGPTPRTEIYRTNKSRLYRYESRRTHRTPLLFVPNLGISRPYIFDLMPRGSFIEHMTGQGFDFYLVDWGVFGPEDNALTVEHAATKILPRLARKALESSGAPEMSVLGYCMGAPISTCFLGTHRDFPVRNFVDMAGPIDFSKVGLFGLWLDPRFFDADRYVDTLGTVPADMVKAGFKLLKPTMDVSTYLNLWWNLWNPDYVSGFNALNKWANEYVAFPGEFFRQWVKDFYQQNRLIRGELRMAGQTVDLKSIRCPVLAIGAREDNIAPPASVRPLIEAVSSTDREYVEMPGGHISLIAGRGASLHCWPKVASWLAARS